MNRGTNSLLDSSWSDWSRLDPNHVTWWTSLPQFAWGVNNLRGFISFEVILALCLGFSLKERYTALEVGFAPLSSIISEVARVDWIERPLLQLFLLLEGLLHILLRRVSLTSPWLNLLETPQRTFTFMRLVLRCLKSEWEDNRLT